MKSLFVKTAAFFLLMLGTAAAQVGGVGSPLGGTSMLGGAGSASLFGAPSPIGGTGIPMGATELGTSGLSPSPAGAGSMATAPVSPLAPLAVTGAVPGLAGTANSFGSSITGFGPGGMQALPGSPGTGLLGNR
jgi:hypothetical protein